MSERKVLSKYYPPDFDPLKISRQRKPKTEKSSAITIRLMSPFSMQCTRCGEFIYKGRKFNARKETADEKYLGISIYLFYIKCTRCSSQIVFKTDPKHQDYVCVSGARRNFEPWREYREEETDEQKLDRLEAEAAEEEKDKMEELESKVVDAKAEMAVADALDEIRAKNARQEAAAKNSGSGTVMTAEQLKRQEDDDFERYAHEQWVAARAKHLSKLAIQKAEVEEERLRKMREEVERDRKEKEQLRKERERRLIEQKATMAEETAKRKREAEEKAATPNKKIKATESRKDEPVPTVKDTSLSQEAEEGVTEVVDLPKRDNTNKPNVLAQMLAMYDSDSDED
jgi:DNA-directed RNA polymerase subunit RPC12/RpoP